MRFFEGANFGFHGFGHGGKRGGIDADAVPFHAASTGASGRSISS